MEAQGRAFAVLELWGPEDEVALALALLVELGSTGAVEDSANGRYRAYFPPSVSLNTVIDDLESTFSEVSYRLLPGLPDRDWLSEWKKSLAGIAIGETVFVHPTWQASPETGRKTIRIDPEQAFGTGLHDTTRLMIELLERWVTGGMSVLDVGTGTGILAMAAVKLGASLVLAIDPDPAAADCAIKNVALNHLGGLVTVECAGLEDYDRLRSDLVVANLSASLVSSALARLDSDVALFSGILVEEVDELIARLPHPYSLSEEWSAGEWSALVLTR
jgi:ribosomal protein L11 methyltransferase